MKFKISQSSFLSGLTVVQRIAGSKQPLPILEMVKISAKDKSITLESTDLNIGVEIKLLAKVEEEGEFIVPIKSFFAQISTFPQEELIFEKKGSEIELTTKQTSLVFATGVKEDFPNLPKVSGLKWSLSKQNFNQIYRLVTPSSANDQIRPILSSVLFAHSENGVEIVATDGIRLSIFKCSSEELPIEHFLFPLKGVLELSRILELSDSESIVFEISHEEQVVQSVIGNIRFFSKLMVGDYPPYKQIIPQEFQTQVLLDKKELEENVKRSIIVGGREAGYFQLEINEEKVIFVTKNQSGESIRSIISSRNFVGGVINIAFSSRFIMDMLKSLSDQDIYLSVSDALKPAVFTVSSEPDFKFIIMPFKVRE